MSTRDFIRPQPPGMQARGRLHARDRFAGDRGARDRYERDVISNANAPDDAYNIYRPPGGGGTTTALRPGPPFRPGPPLGPRAPRVPGRRVPPGPPGGGGWFRRWLRGPWTLKRIAALVAISFGLFVVGIAILIGVAYAQTPIPSAVSQVALQQQSTVYFNDGKTIVGTFGSTDRQLLTLSQIPPVLRDAVLAAEDRHFYAEGGVSITGTLRAAYHDLMGGGGLQGGSTITQQFVRNYYANIGTQQTLSRKIKEIFVSIKLARQKSKDWILTQYLNTIYMGNGAYGVGAAAEVYFGVPAMKVTAAQAAVLAAIIQSPSYYPTPAAHNDLVARWHYVLTGMVAMGDLTPQQAATEVFPKFTGSPQLGNGWTGYNGYIMQAVQNELENTYGYTMAQLSTAGLKIITTFDQSKMAALYRAVNENLRLMRDGGRALPWYAHVGAVLEQPGTGAIIAMYSGPGYDVRACARVRCQWDMALQNREQVGSSFKPYVLATARAQGMSVKTSVLDGYSPICVPDDVGNNRMVYSVRANSTAQSACPSSPDGWYNVSNDAGDGSLGPTTVVVATAASLNTAYTDLTHRVGTQNIINVAQQFGVNVGAYSGGGSGLESMRDQVGIALGQASLTVEEQATMFDTLANDGVYVSPHVIKKIIQGTVITGPKLVRREVLPPDQAADVNYALSFDVRPGGTATNAAMADGREIIGKTGTTNAAQSAFFIGAIPQYSLAVGIFSNIQDGDVTHQSLNYLGGLPGGGYGGDWPSMIWRTYAEQEFAPLPMLTFPAPSFGGNKWDLLGPLLTPQPRRTGRGCDPLIPFCKGGHKCRPLPLPLPGCPSPGPTLPPTPTPTPTKTGQPVVGIMGIPLALRRGG